MQILAPFKWRFPVSTASGFKPYGLEFLKINDASSIQIF